MASLVSISTQITNHALVAKIFPFEDCHKKLFNIGKEPNKSTSYGLVYNARDKSFAITSAKSKTKKYRTCPVPLKLNYLYQSGGPNFP